MEEVHYIKCSKCNDFHFPHEIIKQDLDRQGGELGKLLF